MTKRRGSKRFENTLHFIDARSTNSLNHTVDLPHHHFPFPSSFAFCLFVSEPSIEPMRIVDRARKQKMEVAEMEGLASGR